MDDTVKSSASSSEESTAEQDAPGGAQPEQEEESFKDTPFHEHPRFRQLIADRRQFKEQLEQWSELGDTPSAVKARLEKAQLLEKMLESDEQAPAAEQMPKEERAKVEWARKEMLRIFPELAYIKPTVDALNLHYEALETEAHEATIETLKADGFDTANAKEVEGMERILVEIIQSDKRLLHKYNTGKPEKAVEGAYAKLRERFAPGADRAKRASTQADKQKLTTLPKTFKGPSRTDVGGTTEAPRTLKEADAQVREMLKGMRE